MSLTQSLPLTLDAGARLIIVRASSGRIDHLSLRAPTPPLELMTATRFERWAALLLREPLQSPTNVEIDVVGESFSGLSAEGLAIPRHNPALVTPGRDQDADIAHCAVFIENDSIDAAPDVGSRIASEYFLHLDEESNPLLFEHRASRRDSAALSGTNPRTHGAHALAITELSSEEIDHRKSLIMRTVEFLWQRIWARFDRRSMSPCCLSTGDIRLLSELQLAPIRRYFPQAPAEGVMDAYTRFACGDLRLNVSGLDPMKSALISNACPNGSNVFCFAEFALLAIESGVDEAEWLAIAPALVATQELFLHAFGSIDVNTGLPQPQRFDSYGDRPRRSVDSMLRQCIVDQHCGLTSHSALRQKAAQHALDAFEPLTPISFVRSPDRGPAVGPRKPQN